MEQQTQTSGKGLGSWVQKYKSWSLLKRVTVTGIAILVFIGMVGAATDNIKNIPSVQNQPVSATPQTTNVQETLEKPELKFIARYEANSKNLFLTNKDSFGWNSCTFIINLIYKKEPYKTTTTYDINSNETTSFATFQFRDKDFNEVAFVTPFGLEIKCNNGYWKGSIE